MRKGETVRAAQPARVLITGGAGFIGRHLAEKLLARGSEVVVVDDLRVAPLLPPVGELREKSVLEMDVDDVRDVDVVYHLASHKSVPESFHRPLDYLDNVDSGRHLLRLCQEAAVPRVVVGSTCEVYGNSAQLPNAESSALSPLSPYAASKVALEMLARGYQQLAGSATDVTVVRFFNVYGPGERPDAVVPALCESAITDGVLRIEGTGTQRRDFSYIDDTVRRLIELLDAPSVPTVNMGSGTSLSVLDLALILQEIRPDVAVVMCPGRINEIDEFRADTSVMDRFFDSTVQKIDPRAGILLTYRWWESRLGADADHSRLVKELN